MMQLKNDTTASSGEQTCLSSEAYQTRLDADQTKLATEGYHTVLGAQLQTMPVEAAAAVEDDPELYRIGDYIGDRYEVLTIHRGAWGVIYGTYDHKTELPRALKSIQRKYQFDKQLLELFRDEATLWVQLEKHPYIVRAYSIEEFDEQPFVITEYINSPQGNDLRSWLGSSKLTLGVGVEMALKIAQGMQYAHHKVAGLVHRDLKPANILVDQNAQPYITDFGLVRAAGSDAGTPAYMAPEQWRKEAVTVQTDIYAFGCILYEILTGHRMYPATTVDVWRYMHLFQLPVAPCMLKPEIPAGLEEFVLRCLEKEPDRRPCDWDEIVEALAGWSYQLTGEPPVLDFSAYKLDARELLLASISFYGLNKYPEALAVCERALEIDPEWPTAWYMKSLILEQLDRAQEAWDGLNSYSDPDDYYIPLAKGIILRALEKYEEALITFDQLLETRPDDETILRNKGAALKRLKRYREALDCYDRILEFAPDDYDCWWRKAKILGELDEYDEALIWCRKYVEAKPRDDDGWFEQGFLLIHLSRFDEALDCIDRSLEINPDCSLGWLNKGITLHILKRYDEAVTCFDKVIALEPDKSKAWREKADSLNDLERYREALDCLDRALELNPADDEAWSARGCALYYLERYSEVIPDCDRAVDINLHNEDAWEYKLKALEELAGCEEALALYDQALENCPDDTELWKEKGRVLNELERYEEAIPYFDHVLEINPKHYPAWICKAIALYHLKRDEDSLFSYNKALEFDPENDVSLYYKGLILDNLHRYHEAVEAFEHAEKIDPEEAAFPSSQARSLYHMERYEAAVVCSDRALAINPENKWGLEYKGKCLIKLNRAAEGKACLKKVLELDPDLDIWDDFSERIDLSQLRSES